MLWYFIKDEPLRLVMNWVLGVPLNTSYTARNIAEALGIRETLAQSKIRKLHKLGIVLKEDDNSYSIDQSSPEAMKLRDLFFVSGDRYKQVHKKILENKKITFASIIVINNNTFLVYDGEMDKKVSHQLKLAQIYPRKMTHFERINRYILKDFQIMKVIEKGILLKGKIIW